MCCPHRLEYEKQAPQQWREVLYGKNYRNATQRRLERPKIPSTAKSRRFCTQAKCLVHTEVLDVHLSWCLDLWLCEKHAHNAYSFSAKTDLTQATSHFRRRSFNEVRAKNKHKLCCTDKQYLLGFRFISTDGLALCFALYICELVNCLLLIWSQYSCASSQPQMFARVLVFTRSNPTWPVFVNNALDVTADSARIGTYSSVASRFCNTLTSSFVFSEKSSKSTIRKAQSFGRTTAISIRTGINRYLHYRRNTIS